ncbi:MULTISPECIES: copper homeostasis protein CutC [Microbacterium]|uniref:copper homeostasis protein CutC n=1 Tax=Microbacterium TaxID=33882 RepID=UPI002784D8A5|nr:MULTISPECIES: copper homeostasis protein CutC [Microbacterium]MDQ1082244.1 glucokinase [Microbacterium sp. SORGH_AS_0344]MDQ1168985.1 glucokinase [Microbacterium proteolyticum]
MTASLAAGVPRALVEICVDDLAGVLAAERAGADRVELCADLLEGGTTPSLGMIQTVLASVHRVGVQIMVRSRGGDFVYSDDELRVMVADTRAIAALAETSSVRVGIVFGALTAENRVDVPALAAIREAAGTVPVTFHKAFNDTVDLVDAYETLAQHGVERVLTSGGAATAEEGADVLRALHARSDNSRMPIVLAGGSVRAQNVAALIARTGVREVHLRAQIASDRGHLVTDESVVRDTVAAAAASALPPHPAVVADGGLIRSSRIQADTAQPSNPAVVAVDIGGTSAKGAPVDSDGRVMPGSPGPADGSHPAVVAVDIGGTSAKGALVDVDGRVLRGARIATGSSGAETVTRIADLLRDLMKAADAMGRTVVGAGVVSPGLIDSATGTVLYAATLGWTDVPLARILSEAIGLPVAVGHDVRAAGAAERALGAAAGSGDAVFAAIGTGVAAAITSDGRAVEGAIAGAGELGHIPAVPGGELCTCGQRGCLEVYFSGAGLARRYAAATSLLGDDLLVEPPDAAAIAARVDTDPVAARVWSEGLDALATGLATLTLLVDPEVIVLGGGVAQAGDVLVDPLRARLAAALAWRDAPRLVTAALGSHAGRVGAAMLAFEAAQRSEVTRSWVAPVVLAEPHPQP